MFKADKSGSERTRLMGRWNVNRFLLMLANHVSIPSIAFANDPPTVPHTKTASAAHAISCFMKFFKTKSHGYLNLDQVMQIIENSNGGMTLFMADGRYHELTDPDDSKQIIAVVSGTETILT